MAVRKLNPPQQTRGRFETWTLLKVVHEQNRFWCSISEAKAHESGAVCGGVGLLLGARICSFQFISGVLYNRNQFFNKIQVESDLKFRFELTNSLTQRHTDLSRHWLTVLPKVKCML